MHDDPLPESTMADVGAARGGDSLSWAHLDERLRPWLRGILGSHRLPMGYVADDVINLTFAHVYRDFHRFRVEAGSSFRGWVLSIMLNRLASLVKMAGAHKRDAGSILPLDRAPGSTAGTPQIPDPNVEPASVLARHAELARDFEAAVAGLDPQTRAILEMRVLNDMEFDLIAARVGRKADTVRAIFNRAMQRVRQRMRGHADSG